MVPDQWVKWEAMSFIAGTAASSSIFQARLYTYLGSNKMEVWPLCMNRKAHLSSSGIGKGLAK